MKEIEEKVKNTHVLKRQENELHLEIQTGN